MSIVLIPAYAEECKCDGEAIIKEIKDATWAGSAGWDFADAIYNIKDERQFKSALKDYIESNCTVQDNKIICR